MSKLIKNKKANTKHGHKGEILKGDVLIASVFLFPIFLFLVALFFYPLIQTLWLSFTSFSSFREPQRFWD